MEPEPSPGENARLQALIRQSQGIMYADLVNHLDQAATLLVYFWSQSDLDPELWEAIGRLESVSAIVQTVLVPGKLASVNEG